MTELQSLLSKASRGEGLLPEEARVVLDQSGPDDWEAIFGIAAFLTRKNFGRKLYFYIPIYFSSSCVNDCVYCGYRRSNTGLRRIRLTAEELVQEASCLWDEGFGNLLLVAGEHSILAGEERVSALVTELMRVRLDFCVSVEVGPLTADGYRFLSRVGVQRVTLYQETYDREVYARLHEGPKKDYDWRYHAMGRAMEAGITKVGLGILLGISDSRSDLIELIRHAWLLKNKYGHFPVTVSFPRMRQASGLDEKDHGFLPVGDSEFEKIIALTRLALPFSGIPLTTRESAAYRDRLLKLGIGVTHLSAGTKTSPGGYQVHAHFNEEGQFSIEDERPLPEMVRLVKTLGYEPVFRFENENLLNSPVLKE